MVKRKIPENGIVLKRQISEFFRLKKTIKNWHKILFDYLGLQKHPYLLKMRDGTRLKMIENDRGYIVVDENWNNYEFLDKDIKEKDLIIDVGGYIGDFSVYISRFTKNKIYCLEPSKLNYNFVLENIKINNIKNIVPINMAVTKDGRNVSIRSATDSNFISSIYPRVNHEPFEISKIENKGDIRSVTLEDFIRNNKIQKIDLLKIDVEGAEYEILFNLLDNVFEKIDKILAEIHIVDLHLKRKDMVDFLIKKGYEPDKDFMKLNPDMFYGKRKKK